MDKLLRENIRNLKPYSSARHEFSGKAEVFLDANENPFGIDLNRYPDPFQMDLKNEISKIKNISPENIMLGNGSDEIIDLMIRIFCEPHQDKIVICPPTYGMYKVYADIAAVPLYEVPLLADFQLDVDAILKLQDPTFKLLFLCSPNNPSGNLLAKEDIQAILDTFKGIVLIDEAYIDFTEGESWIQSIPSYPRLLVMQTLSKAWGLAAIRCGMAFANSDIIQVLNKVKAPYNVNILTQRKAAESLQDIESFQKNLGVIIQEKKILFKQLSQLDIVDKVYPSDANFLLVKMNVPAQDVYRYLVEENIVVRDRSNVKLCENCLRITVGKPVENELLINVMINFPVTQTRTSQ